MYQHNKNNHLIRRMIYGIALAVLCLFSCAVYAEDQEGQKRLCPEDKLIMIREAFIGMTLSKYSIYDCCGNYIGSTFNNNYMQKNVDLINKNEINVVHAEDGTYVYLLGEHMRSLKMDPVTSYVRAVGNLLAADDEWDQNGFSKFHVLNRDGREIFTLPKSEWTTESPSSTIKETKYIHQGEEFDYYFAGSMNWEDFYEAYLIDEEGNILESYNDPEFVRDAMYSDSVFVNGKWYMNRWDGPRVYDAFGYQIGTCSEEEYYEMSQTKKVVDEYQYVEEGQEIVLSENEKVWLIRGRDADDIYTEIRLKADGSALEERTGYNERLIIKDDYYIVNSTRYQDDTQDTMHHSQICDYDGNILMEFYNASVDGWPQEEYMTMEHGKYRGLIDLDGNWVLRVICADGTD